MATLRQRLHRKNASGVYDVIHYETDSQSVIMEDGTTLETKMSSHTHSASNITSGVLSVSRGGTGNSSVDTKPTSGSTKMCTSGGIYTEINTLKTSVSEGKALVAAAVTDKGVQTAADATFQTIATNIGEIETGIKINGLTQEYIVSSIGSVSKGDFVSLIKECIAPKYLVLDDTSIFIPAVTAKSSLIIDLADDCSVYRINNNNIENIGSHDVQASGGTGNIIGSSISGNTEKIYVWLNRLYYTWRGIIIINHGNDSVTYTDLYTTSNDRTDVPIAPCYKAGSAFFHVYDTDYDSNVYSRLTVYFMYCNVLTNEIQKESFNTSVTFNEGRHHDIELISAKYISGNLYELTFLAYPRYDTNSPSFQKIVIEYNAQTNTATSKSATAVSFQNGISNKIYLTGIIRFSNTDEYVGFLCVDNSTGTIPATNSVVIYDIANNTAKFAKDSLNQIPTVTYSLNKIVNNPGSERYFYQCADDNGQLMPIEFTYINGIFYQTTITIPIESIADQVSGTGPSLEKISSNGNIIVLKVRSSYSSSRWYYYMSAYAPGIFPVSTTENINILGVASEDASVGETCSVIVP